MAAIARWASIFGLAIKRLWSHRGLMASIALGFATAISLVMSIPLYADAVGYGLLRQQLTQDSSRPPFAFLYRYVGAWSGAIDWQDYAPVDEYLSTGAPPTLGLPLQFMVRHVKTDNLRLFATEAGTYADTRQPLEWINLGFASSFREHIEIVEGTFPNLASPFDQRFEVLIQEGLANSLGLQPGEEYILYGGQQKGGYQPATLKVHISGVWRPIDPGDPFWFYQIEALRNTLMVPEETFVNQVVAKLDNPVHLAAWYLVFPMPEIHTQDLQPFLLRAGRLNHQVRNLLGDISLDVSPLPALEEYGRTALLMTMVMLIFALPVIAVVLYFLAMISGMLVQRERNEIAVLRSRGASSGQVLLLYAVEMLLVGACALILALPASRTLAQIMGNSRAFLSFAPSVPLPIVLSPQSLLAGMATMCVALSATLAPAFSAAGYTIVTHKQDVARSLRRPFWQRYFLDILLLIPALYGYYLLRGRGTIAVLGRDLTPGSDPFGNPLLFLVPTLFLLGTALVFIRLLPWFMAILARLGRWLPGPGWTLALTHLSRSAIGYMGPVLLIVLTISLAVFSASMAKTLDTHIMHRIYYGTGADLFMIETGASPDIVEGDRPPIAAGAREDDALSRMRWLFLPVSEHLSVPGVLAATRVGSYAAVALVGGERVEGRFLGVDRVDWPQVGFFRGDFAPLPLGGLMNILAMRSQGLLVSSSFLEERGLMIGDTLRLEIFAFSDSRPILFTVSQAVDYFPTAYPEEGPIFVGNLDYFFQEMGAQYPYDVWLRTDGRDASQIIRGVEELGLRVLSSRDAHEMVRQARARPEQRGSFGLLSIGFIAAAGLTVMGFLLHGLVRFRERLVELGVLRSIGLSKGQMTFFLAGEIFLLIPAGTAGGTGVGLWASRLFLPFFQLGGGPYPGTPPFLVHIAWGDITRIYAIMGGMFLAAILTTLWPLSRMRIFEAIKLGEAI